MITDVRKIDIGWSLRYYADNFAPAIKWCSENIKKDITGEYPYGYPWSREHHREYVYFTFGRESDTLMFILRWS